MNAASPTDEELIAEIELLSAEIKRLCAQQVPMDLPTEGRRNNKLARLQAELAYARQCVCQEKLAKWEARANG